MSRLNLEGLTTFSLLDAIASPAVQETAPSGSGSFGALFERARSALSQASPSTSGEVEDTAPARDSRAAENDRPAEKSQGAERRDPAEDPAPREASEEPSETRPAAEMKESSESPAEASQEPEAAQGTEVKSDDDSTEAVDAEETSGDEDVLPPAESSSTDAVPAADTSTESESGDTETSSEDDSKESDEAAAVLVVAMPVDVALPAPPIPSGETGATVEGDPDTAFGVKLAAQPAGPPPLPTETAGATGQSDADPAAADAVAATAAGEASTTEGVPAGEGQAGTVPMPPTEVVDSEGGQGEGDAEQTDDGQGRPSRRNSSAKGLRATVADQAAVTPSTSTTGQNVASPQVETGAAASQVASSVAATAAGAATSDAVPSESKGNDAGTSEVSGGQSVAQGQASRGSSTQASEDQSGVSQADRVRFVQRVARAFESVGDQGGTIRLKLHPAELGSLRLEVTVRNGAMTARLEAETSAAQGMLLENLPALRERLAEQNIRVERFDVDVMGQSSGGTADGTDAQSQSGQGQAQQRPSYSDYRNTGVESTNQPRRAVTAGGASRFDVIV